jgi:hypothetical protein
MVSAILWLVLRLASRKYLDVHAGMNLGVLSNILIILVLVFVSLLSHHRQRQLQGIEVITFLDDFKRTLRYCLTFVLASAVAMLLYYGALSNDIIEIKNASVTAFEGMLRDEAGRAVFMGQHEELTGKSDAELIANFKSQLDSNVTVHSRIIGSVFALLLVSLAYSLLGVVIWRNFMRGGTTRL